MKVSNYTSYLSQLIYNSQPVVLQHCLDRVEAGELADMSGCIVADLMAPSFIDDEELVLLRQAGSKEIESCSSSNW